MTHPTQDKPTSVTGFSSSFYFLCPSVVSFFFVFLFTFFFGWRREVGGGMVTDNSTMPHNVVFISKMILEMYTVHCVKTMDTHNPEKREKENIIIFFFFSNEATNGLILIHHSQCVVLCVHYAYIACSLLYVFIPPAEISWVPFLAVVVVFTGCAQTDDMRTLLRGTSLLKLLTRQYNIVRRLARCLVRWDLNRRITLVENLLF